MNREDPVQLPPQSEDDLVEFPKRQVEKGTRWRRTHRRERHPWYFSSGGGRFDLYSPLGTCYLASSNEVAARELIGPDIARAGVVAASLLEGRVVSTICLPDAIEAAHVSCNEAFSFGVTNELCSISNYDITREWAQTFRDAGFEGVWYRPRFSPGDGARALAVFGKAGESDVDIHEVVELKDVVARLPRFKFVDPDQPEEFEILNHPIS